MQSLFPGFMGCGPLYSQPHKSSQSLEEGLGDCLPTRPFSSTLTKRWALPVGFNKPELRTVI